MNKFKNILTFTFALILMVFSVNVLTVSANEEYSDGKDIELELRDVDLTVYEDANTTDVISLAETGFGTNDYSLIVYVYNHNKKPLVTDSLSNVINMSCRFVKNVETGEYEAVEYANFKLKYISNLSDYSVYKFKIEDKDGILKQRYKVLNAFTGKRTYTIVGIQLFEEGDTLAEDYKVACDYIYSGYGEEVGPGFKQTLETNKTISLDLNYVWYRTDGSSNGKYHQHQINSVYFAVPNYYFNDNYTLHAVKAEWYEYKTKPIVVLQDQEKFNKIYNNLALDLNGVDYDIPSLSYGANVTLVSLAGSSGRIKFDWSYNKRPFVYDILLNKYRTYSSSECSCLYYAFSTNGESYEDYEISKETLENYIYNYNKSAVNGYLDIKGRNVSADLFEDTVDSGRTKGYNEKIITVDDTFDLFSYKSTHNFLQIWEDYGFWAWITGEYPTEESREHISPIHIIDIDKDFEDNMVHCDDLLVDTRFSYDLYNYVDIKSKEKIPKTTCLFRFGYTDYFSAPLDSEDGYVAQETVFLDFDVLHLDFYNGNEHVIVPVVSSPIDGVASPTPPKDFTYDKGWVLYAFIGVMVAVAGIGFYSVFRKEN